MKTKYTFLFLYLDEYKNLEHYLEDMCEKGWMLTQRITLFGSIFRFQKITPVSRKFCVVYNNCYDNIWSNRNEQREQDYIEFIKDYGYQYITGDDDFLYFYHDKKDAIEIMEDNEDNQKRLQKMMLVQTLSFIPLFLITAMSLNKNYGIDFLHWCSMMAPREMILMILTILLGFYFIVYGIHTIMFMIKKKSTFNLTRIKVRTTCFLGIAIIGEFIATNLLSYVNLMWAISILLAQVFFLIVLLALMRRTYKNQRIIYGFLFLFGFCSLLAVLSAYDFGNRKMLNKQWIPFTCQELEGISCKSNQKFMQEYEYVFLKNYEISQTYYTQKEGSISKEGYEFTYLITIVKDTFMKEEVLKQQLLHAKKQPSSYDFDIYYVNTNNLDNYFLVGNHTLLLVKDYKIVTLPEGVQINNTNAAIFEKAFQFNGSGELL